MPLAQLNLFSLCEKLNYSCHLDKTWCRTPCSGLFPLPRSLQEIQTGSLALCVGLQEREQDTLKNKPFLVIQNCCSFLLRHGEVAAIPFFSLPSCREPVAGRTAAPRGPGAGSRVASGEGQPCPEEPAAGTGGYGEVCPQLSGSQRESGDETTMDLTVLHHRAVPPFHTPTHQPVRASRPTRANFSGRSFWSLAFPAGREGERSVSLY